MEHLAARLWRSGRAAWTVGDVEQWLLEFLRDRPDLELHYPVRAPGLWKQDLRTATFLVRRADDTFAFAHTSLREFFLARHLARALDAGDAAAWSIPVPSRETLAFLAQLLAGLDDDRVRTCRAAPTDLARSQPGSPAAVLAFAYGLTAGDHSLAGSRLDSDRWGVRSGWVAGGDHERRRYGAGVGCGVR